MKNSTRKKQIESESFEELLEASEELGDTKVPKEVVQVSTELLDTNNDTIGEALDTTESSLSISPTERGILECALAGNSVNQIAIKLCVPLVTVRTYLRRKAVKEFISEVKTSMNEIDQMMITSVMRKTLGARIDKIEEGSGDYSLITKKDTLDIIKVFSDITNNIHKQQKEEKSDDVFVNIYNQILS